MLKWKLRSIMADRKMSAIALSKLLGHSRSTVSEWMSMDTIPNFREAHQTLEALIKELDCSFTDLIQEMEGESSPPSP